MVRRSISLWILSASIAGTVALTGCASVQVPRDPIAAVARLEKEREAKPTSLATIRALGVAYYANKQYPQARAALEEVRKADPKDGIAALYSGLTAEAQDDIGGAKEAYTTYLANGKSANARDQVKARLAFVARQELTLAAKSALQQEVRLNAEGTNAKTIAVPPFRFTGADTSLKPLERGLSDLMITDLSVAPEITVLERDKMQAMLDEVSLSQGNRVDQNTSVRAGRLMRAGRIVQGGVTQTSATGLQLNASVVDVPTAKSVGSATQNDELEQLFSVEKRLALNVLQTLGITLTPEQRALIETQRPTKSLAAFLAYSRGLESEDRGDFSGALGHYGDAVRLDPGFLRATFRQQSTQSINTGASVSSSTVETGLKGTSEGTVSDNAKQGSSNTSVASSNPTATSVVNVLNPNSSSSQTNATQPASGTGSTPGGSGSQPSTNTNSGTNPNTQNTGNKLTPTQTGTITIIIKQP
jgi:TolB-like protein